MSRSSRAVNLSIAAPTLFTSGTELEQELRSTEKILYALLRARLRLRQRRGVTDGLNNEFFRCS